MGEAGVTGLGRLTRRAEQLRVVRATRNALVNMIPVLTIGAFALILQTLPIPAYQSFLETSVGVVLMQFLQAGRSGCCPST